MEDKERDFKDDDPLDENEGEDDDDETKDGLEVIRLGREKCLKESGLEIR